MKVLFRSHHLWLCAIVAAILAGGFALFTVPARATFPGANGLVSFARIVPETGLFQIFTLDPSGTGLMQITDSATSTSIDPDWSPDGSRIAFDSDRDPIVNIYTANPDGTDVIQLTHGGFNAEPAWSPDGSQIAFESDQGNFPTGEGIYVMDSDGGNVSRLTVTPLGFIDASPQWSPNKDRIVFFRFDGTGSALFIVRPDGSHLRQITPWELGASNPDWSPDGKLIVFNAPTCGFSSGCGVVQPGEPVDLYVVRPNGSGLTQLTHNGLSRTGFGIRSFDPCWSPDSSRIIFTRRQGPELDDADLYTINPDGSGLQLFSNMATIATAVDWGSSPG
jgi:Tol biopolymer transport system component